MLGILSLGPCVGGSWCGMTVWDLSDGSAREMEGHKDAVLCVRWIDNERFASCSKDKTICIWDAENYTLLRQLEGHSDWVKTISIDLQQNIIRK